MDLTKPAELLIFEFLQEQVDAASNGDVLYELAVHDTIWQAMDKNRPQGIRIADTVSEMVPIGEGELKEFDVETQLVCFARVEGTNQKARGPALQKVFEIEKAVLAAIYADYSLGDRVCDVQIVKIVRGYDSIDGNPYAVVNISLVINPSGEQ